MAESSGYLALRWKNHSHIFAKILDDLRVQESYTDVSLSCGGQFYAAHKFVLSTCSDYFREMFSRTTCRHPVVYMQGVNPWDLASLLDFMYKGEVHVAEGEVASLLLTAEALKVKGLAVPDNPPPDAPPLPQGVLQNTVGDVRTPASVLPTLVAKRKRITDAHSKKDDPPRLTPLPGAPNGVACPTQSPQSQDQSDSTLRRLAAPPELKRIKLSDSLSLNSAKCASTASVTQLHNGAEGRSVELSVMDHSRDGPLLNGPDLSGKTQCSEERSNSSSEDALGLPKISITNNQCNSTNNSSLTNCFGSDECRADVDDDSSRHSRASSYFKEEAFQNNGLCDIDDDTGEVLQVDLSEDGSQFIIGPGGRLMGSEREDALEDDAADGQKKPFVCPLCGHDFTRRDNLANHLKTHTGDRPYMCQYCHKCFSRKDYLKQHERIHTGEKPYQCQLCDRAFTRKEGLTDHMRCHSDNKEFACEKNMKNKNSNPSSERSTSGTASTRNKFLVKN